MSEITNRKAEDVKNRHSVGYLFIRGRSLGEGPVSPCWERGSWVIHTLLPFGIHLSTGTKYVIFG